MSTMARSTRTSPRSRSTSRSSSASWS
jgi:hypothetical protein